MIPASKATLASTIPGPPRAFVVIARFTRSSPRNPARRPANETERIFTTQLPRRNAATIQNEKPRIRSSFNPTIAKYSGFPDSVEGLREQPSLRVNDGEARKKSRKHQAHIECSSHYAIPEKNGQCVRDRRVFREHIEARFVDTLYSAGDNCQAKPEESNSGDQVICQFPRVERRFPRHRRGHGQRHPQHDVFQYSHAQNQPGEARMQYFQVRENLRDHRYRRDCNSDGENDDQRSAIAIRPGKCRTDQRRPSASPRTNGIPVPTIASQLTSRRSSRVNSWRASDPDRNISKSRPNQ